MSLLGDQGAAQNNTGDGKPAEGQELKGEEGKKPEGEPKKPEEGAKPPEGGPKAPETYEPFKMPEGKALAGIFDAKEFSAIAKELNLPQEGAQKFVDFLAAIEGKAADATQKELKALFDKQAADWKAELRADPDFGGKDYQHNSARAEAAFDRYDKVLGGKLSALIEEHRLEFNPVLAKLFLHLDKAISEDKFVEGERGSGGHEKSLAEKLYPDQGKK